ncbi:MAG: immunogenic protein, partial [Chloroflexota bacterium]|nr:immunogenic protein [Chloroflexota bacterium]
MSKTRSGYVFSVLVMALVTVFAFSAIDSAYAAERKSLRLATSAVGSYGYQIAALMTRIVEEALGGEYTVTVQPYTSPTVAMKAVMDGTAEIAYTADIGMGEFHQRVGGFKDYKPKMPELVHTWYSYPMESMMAVAAKDADKFKCWRDFSGKPVFYTNAGFMNWLNYMRVFKVLGYDFKHVQIDLNSNADALERGSIVGSGVYTTAGRSLPAYWKETEIRMDIRVVNPCPDEVAKIKAAGLAVVDVDPKSAFSKNVGPATLMGVAI